MGWGAGRRGGGGGRPREQQAPWSAAGGDTGLTHGAPAPALRRVRVGPLRA